MTVSADFETLVAERVHDVRERIRRAGGQSVSVLAVTKTRGIDACWAAYRAGCTSVGENYAQELVAKLSAGPWPFGVHFIGQLQTNKVRQLAPLVTCFETVDRPSLVAELAKRAPGASVLVQIAPDDQPGKGGCALASAPSLVDAAQQAGLDVRGLMAVGPTAGGPQAARPLFRAVRALADRMGLAVVSMGMSDDLEVAVQEGSTQVRVGSALFGARTVADPPVR